MKSRKSSMTAALMVAAIVLGVAGCGGSEAPGPSPSTGTTNPSASNLVVTLGKTSVANASTETVAIVVTTTTATGQGVGGVSVTLGADSSVLLTPGTVLTGSGGTATATLSLVGKANRAVTVNAASGTLRGSASLIVQGATLSATVVTPQPAVGANVRVDFALRDSANNGMPGETITISSSRNSFAPVTARTDASGNYSLQYTAPSTAGDDVIIASAAGAKPLADPVIRVGASTNPTPSSTPRTFSLQASPTTVPANLSGSSNQSQLSARVFDVNNNPVANASVSFRIAQGASFGALASAGNVLTDGDGFARTTFVPGSSGSAQDQIVVCAIVNNVATAPSPSNPLPGKCNSTESGVQLTVSNQPVSIVIAPSGVILVPDDLTYIQQFVVQVAQVGGAPVSGALVSVDPIEHAWFYKGFWAAPAGSSSRRQTVTATCPNEDANRNDILDPGEDKNGNGRLDPRRPVNFRFAGDGKTSALGQAILEVIYPKAFGSWVSMQVGVRVTVGGSESRAVWQLDALPVSAAEVNGQGAPAFVVSPFGVQPGCDNTN